MSMCTCNVLTWYGKKDFTTVIKLRELRQEDYPELSGRAWYKPKGLYKKQEEGSEWEVGDVTSQEVGVMWGRPWTDGCRWPLEAEKTKEWIPSSSSPEEQTCHHLDFRLLTSSCYSVAKSCLTLQPHGLQHIRLPCPSPSPGACSNLCPLNRWCYLTISSSVACFSFNLSHHQGLF